MHSRMHFYAPPSAPPVEREHMTLHSLLLISVMFNAFQALAMVTAATLRWFRKDVSVQTDARFPPVLPLLVVHPNQDQGIASEEFCEASQKCNRESSPNETAHVL